MKKSSCIRDVLKCGDNLLIEFYGDKCYEFIGAGGHEKAMRDALSKGAYFNAQIKNKYTASKF